MANSPLAIRPNPHSVTAPTIITMSSPTATSDAQSPAGDEAERARTATEAWKPAMNRRLSWNREEQKRSLQMGSIADVTTGPGFTERSATA